MEQRNDDLNDENDLPAPGTEEPESPDSGGSPEAGPGNVSVDEPTAAALEQDAGSPGGADADEDDGSDDDSSDEDSEDDDSEGDEDEAPSGA